MSTDEQDDNELWYRVTLLVEAARGVDAAAILWDFDAAGVETQDRDTYADDGTMKPVPEGTNRLVAFFQKSTPAAASELERDLVDELQRAQIPPLAIMCERFTDRTWETAWKDYFKPTLLSPRAIVGPPWEDFEAPEDGTKIVIEPGMAFGTGTHETTQLCAEHIDRLLARSGDPLSVLDVGCGSAILSMIARRLGADPVVGIDVDETAVDVARENLRVNKLEGEVDLSTTPVGKVEGTFDVVVANILTHVLLHIGADLRERVAPGGVLLLSGITVEQAPQIRDAFVGGEFGGGEFVEVAMYQRGEWVCFELRRDV